MDFDDLMTQAIQKIEDTRGECSIRVNQREIKMNDLEWLMVDEYQDFSKLFHDLVSVIRKNNPKLKLICVGDDWQAINAFAGSNLRYFHGFMEKHPDAEISHLLTNFRSKEKIISNSNQLMYGLGEPGTALLQNQGGDIFPFYVDDTRIVIDKEKNEKKPGSDERFVFYTRNSEGKQMMYDNGYITARYLKSCYEIITRKENIGKNVAILSRTGRIYNATLDEFLRKLRHSLNEDELKTIGDFSSKIRAGTAHSFKGLEAEVVIILRACTGYFPMIHPDNTLFHVFGQTEKDILDEERRLFYVALTRAKSSLYIITERENKSDFIKKFNSKMPSQTKHRNTHQPVQPFTHSAFAYEVEMPI